MTTAAEGGESGPFREIGAVVFAVEELAEVRDWYAGIIGRDPDESGPTFVAWRLAGGWLGFDADSIVGGPSREPSSVSYWRVPDIFSAYARLAAAGAVPRGGINELEGVKLAVLIDPWANPIGLVEE